MNLIRERTLNKNFMNWKDLKPQIEKANRQINLHKDECSEFYKRQRMYWNGFKHGIGLAYKIFKATKDSTMSESKVLNIPRVMPVCPQCGSNRIINRKRFNKYLCADCEHEWANGV